MPARNNVISGAIAATIVLAAGSVAIGGPGHGAHSPEFGTADAPLDIVRAPSHLPAAVGEREPRTERVILETVEVTGRLAEGAAYHYWTFNKKVPGPFIRIRAGDTVEVSLRNHEESVEKHNVDFHAVTGLHGGGQATTSGPGETKDFTFKALNPGLYVYHCAVPMAAQHVSNGMYGLILVEPEGGLPPVDREFYVMQGELYTEQPFGSAGELTESIAKLLDDRPEYYVFNGAVEALTGDNALRAKVGETIRIYFGVGGPNKTSSFHVIGEIFDKAYNLGSLTAAPLTDVQTITVAPGGAAAVDLKLEAPGDFVLVDHALSRTARGLVGKLLVEGPDQPEVIRAGSGKPTGS